MNWQNLVVVVQVLSALIIIGLVLLQHGKGADMGAAFGSGASGSLFGATGSSNFMSRATGVAAAVFFISTLILANLSAHSGAVKGGLLDRAGAPATPAVTVPAPAPVTAPVAPVTTTPIAPAPVAPAVAPAAASAPASATK
ncbi:MAG: preprotein translocase subunit SecG [Massilia sp.]